MRPDLWPAACDPQRQDFKDFKDFKDFNDFKDFAEHDGLNLIIQTR